MDREGRPSKSDIQSVFRRLRHVTSNKTCFDCGANNPTWASVTYGVFLCIDCSAVHRSLGVHLTFIRSTQLDTNWTWVQLRAMQVGGNANAEAFFRQHGCNSNDAQQKYNSRAAQLYKSKLEKNAFLAQKQNGSKLFLDGHGEPCSPDADQKEIDFFKEHTELAPPAPVEDLAGMTLSHGPDAAIVSNRDLKNGSGDRAGPNVEAALGTSPTNAVKPPSIIGSKTSTRKPRTGGLGASRVKTDFSQIERAAQKRDQEIAESARIAAENEAQRKEQEEIKAASMRLAYKDVESERQKQDERMKRMDPKKAQQMERLGMGSIGLEQSRGLSHSAFTDMKVIEQEGPTSGSSTDRYAFRASRKDDFFSEFERPSRNSDLGGSDSKWDRPSAWDSSSWNSKPDDQDSRWTRVVNDKNDRGDYRSTGGFQSDNSYSSRKTTSNAGRSVATDGDEAQRKFGDAKAISSDAYFGPNRDRDGDSMDSNRFAGSQSISSDDYFNRTSSSGRGQSNVDLQDLKDGVRQGVTKVAGKLSSIANGVVNSLQKK